LEIWRSGDLEIWRSGDLEIWRSGDLEIWRSGDLEMRMGNTATGLMASARSVATVRTTFDAFAADDVS
jgi:hypothetical protein